MALCSSRRPALLRLSRLGERGRGTNSIALASNLALANSAYIPYAVPTTFVVVVSCRVEIKILRRFPPRHRRDASQGRRRPHDAPARVEVHRTHVARELGIRELGKKSHRFATSSSPAPVVPRLPVPQALWHPLIDYWLVVYREKIAISMLGLDILAGQGEGSSELFLFMEK